MAEQNPESGCTPGVRLPHYAPLTAEQAAQVLEAQGDAPYTLLMVVAAIKADALAIPPE